MKTPSTPRPPIHHARRSRATRRLPARLLLAAGLLAALPAAAQEPVSHWRFDQEGGIFENMTGGMPARVQPEGMDLPLVGDRVGDVTRVVEFDGTGNAWIAAPSDDPGPDFAIELWVKPGRLDRDQILFGNTSGLMIMARPKGRIAFFLMPGDEAQWSYLDIEHAANEGEWIHLMARFHNGTQQLVIEQNGTVLESKTAEIAAPKMFNWRLTFLGINKTSLSAIFEGHLAALKISRGSLSNEEFLASKP